MGTTTKYYDTSYYTTCLGVSGLLGSRTLNRLSIRDITNNYFADLIFMICQATTKTEKYGTLEKSQLHVHTNTLYVI